ncbi:MAG: acyltransferase [Curvibacter sp.]|nr:MAG: acyltransferase [Curvibacter sp.]
MAPQDRRCPPALPSLGIPSRQARERMAPAQGHSTMETIRKNNFDFLRLLAASLVFLSHERSISGQLDPAIFPNLTFGKLGVCIFFAISGYLVTESWNRDPHPIRFLMKRILRIWPGLIAATVLVTLVIGPWVTTLSLKAYFSDPLLLTYWQVLRLKISFALPGVFENNPYPSSVNGSLWTIPIEVQCYLILLVLGLCRITRVSALFIVLNILVGRLSFNLEIVTQDNFNLIDLGLYFAYGICLSTGQRYWTQAPMACLAVCLAISSLCYHLGLYPLAIWMTLPYLVILIGTRSSPWIREVGRYGDFSYGVYIYAFPIQQTVAHFLHDSLSYGAMFAWTYGLTLLAAGLSWYGIERPALRLKPLSNRAKAQPGSSGQAHRPTH